MRHLLVLAVLALLAACSAPAAAPPADQPAEGQSAAPVITVFRPPT